MTTFPEYEQYDATGLAQLVRTKQVTAEELLDAAIERVDARNPAVNAVISRRDDAARESIRAGLPEGPFTGVPFLLKDLNGWLAGDRVTRGSQFFADTPAAAMDSVHVGRLKAAGLVMFGRTNTCEAGLSLTCEPKLYGATRSPWNTDRISGGSSGGSAAAVGARMLPMAHASDGFGSIRAPAACCGLVGLKPTRGRNTMAPYTGEGLAGCSTEHAVTLTMRDTAALLDATRGIAPGDPYTAPVPERSFMSEIGAAPRRLRIAFTTKTPNDVPVADEYLRALDDTVQLCESLGHDIRQADPMIDAEQMVPAFLTIIAVNTVVNLSSHPAKKRAPEASEVEKVTYATAKMGERIASGDYVRATQTMHRLGRQMAAFHRDWDVLLTPALGTLPPSPGWIDMMMDDVDEYWRRVFAFSPFTVLANLSGQPALTLPLGEMRDGFPASVQLVAPFGDERTLIRLGAQLEEARPWFNRFPSITLQQ
ncbi:MAG TPA: amidase [Gemmatimonadaceae bacterium]|jgi:Asp-tRNA(Asn)/Glu-tRNA(Gln) amidotransferase A subunit family amidase